MGYLNNSVVTVDAILTKKGRELLARGDGSFKITQFALSDDEIDYTYIILLILQGLHSTEKQSKTCLF
jgi:hypothetical protein